MLGLGIVGQAQVRMFKRRHEIVAYDPALDGARYPAEAISECGLAVVAVGTPPLPDGSCDLSQVHSAIGALPDVMPVMIRSTVPVGTTEAIASRRGGFTVHCPEFMHENKHGAWQESYDVPFMMIGGNPPASYWFTAVMSALTDAVITTGASSETELAKLVTNSFEAVKLAFVSQVWDICQSKEVDYENVRRLWTSHPQVDPGYTSMTGFGKGFGGRCLPKDLDDLAGHLPQPNLFSLVSQWNKDGCPPGWGPDDSR